MAISMAAALIGAAVIGGGTALAAGSAAAKAQRKGAETSAAASERATQAQIAESQRQYDTTRADYAPYREAGYGALGKLAGMYGVTPTNADGTPVAGGVAQSMGLGYAGDGGFTASPGYAFRRSEGLKAVERGASASGALGSGGAVKAKMRYADGLASSEYDTYASRLAALAGIGTGATGATAAAGANASNQITSAYGANGANQGAAATAAGNARASSYANAGSTINGTVNNLASLYMYQNGGGFGGGGPMTLPRTGGTIYVPGN